MQLFVNQLTNIDFSFLDRQRGMVGETWLASVMLDGTLDDQGMVCDFGVVKKVLRHWLDDQIDHRLLIPAQSPALTIHHMDDSRIDLSWTYAGGTMRLQSPLQAVTLVDASEITAQSMAVWCQSRLQPMFDTRLKPLDIGFEDEGITDAYYHYSHGLKKHAGNCQRIAHGHRSRVQIWLDNERSAVAEQAWAEQWRDIYIGTREDLLADDNGQLIFAYEAAQGAFRLEIPASHCYMMETDTTVELIAAHMADCVRQQYPGKQVRVRAFEGLNKGAQVGS